MYCQMLLSVKSMINMALMTQLKALEEAALVASLVVALEDLKIFSQAFLGRSFKLTSTR